MDFGHFKNVHFAKARAGWPEKVAFLGFRA